MKGAGGDNVSRDQATELRRMVEPAVEPCHARALAPDVHRPAPGSASISGGRSCWRAIGRPITSGRWCDELDVARGPGGARQPTVVRQQPRTEDLGQRDVHGVVRAQLSKLPHPIEKRLKGAMRKTARSTRRPRPSPLKIFVAWTCSATPQLHENRRVEDVHQASRSALITSAALRLR
jgi:hypothetical protein